MEFMLLLKGDSTPDTPPPAELIEAMNQFSAELAAAGVLLDAKGLFSSALGARVVYSNGQRTVVDGPFAEAKELVAGYYLIDVKSRQEAIEWASRCPVDKAVSGDQEAVVEVRQSASSVEEPYPQLADRD
ncbi:YciI family protein [Plantactinospora siamensis]|uniref:YciI family protein n=1 Tax=Plantactinospora siamensis TaxID=555372 RepID=A0ABV6NQT2_9ACTN